MSHPIVGLVGPSGAGKSTLAKAITESDHAASVVSLAGPLRRLHEQATGQPCRQADGSYRPGVRQSLGAMGMGMRDLDPDVWARIAHREARERAKTGLVIIDDVRFANELPGLSLVIHLRDQGPRPTDVWASEQLGWRSSVDVQTLATCPVLRLPARPQGAAKLVLFWARGLGLGSWPDHLGPWPRGIGDASAWDMMAPCTSQD